MGVGGCLFPVGRGIVLLLYNYIYVFLMNTSEELKARAAEIRDAEQAGENTAQRVGSLLCDLVDLLVGEGDIEEAVITATQKLVSRGDVEAAGKVTARRLEATESELGNASAGVLNLLGAGRGAIYIQQLGTFLRIHDLNTQANVFIPTGKDGVVAMVGDTATKGEAAALAARLVPLEGSGTARVEPSGGTFYRYGAACTDNWCERYVSSALPLLTVETADAARKFNLRDSVDAGVYIASGSGQRWNIRVPAGYVIRSYRIVAQLRAGQQEGTVFLTPEGGDAHSVISASETTVNATVGAQSTYFTTEDVSTEPLDRQVWLKLFEVVVERTFPYATTLDTDALRDALNARVMDLGDFGCANALNAALADNAPGRACVMLGHVLNAQGYRAYATVCFSVPFATGQYGGFFQGCLTSAGNMQGFATRTVTKNAAGARTSTAWTLLTNA